jgi:hypothetical protein
MANVSVRIAPIVTKSCSFPTLFPTFEVAEMIALDQETVLRQKAQAPKVATRVRVGQGDSAPTLAEVTLRSTPRRLNLAIFDRSFHN